MRVTTKPFEYIQGTNFLVLLTITNSLFPRKLENTTELQCSFPALNPFIPCSVLLRCAVAGTMHYNTEGKCAVTVCY